MPPQEFSRSPQPDDRPPRPQPPLSIDGVSPAAARRPMRAPHYAPRPNYGAPRRRPDFTQAASQNAQPPAPPIVQPSPQPIQPPAPQPPVIDEPDDELFESLNTAEPAPYVPPSQAQPVPSPSPAPVPEPSQPMPTSQPEPEPLLPAGEPVAKLPRPKRRFHVPKQVVVTVLAALVAGGGTFGWLHYQAINNDPLRVFQNALKSALSTSQVEITTTGATTTTADLDFSVPTNVLVSTKATVNVNGSPAQLAGYGSASKTYFSYQQLPGGVSPALAATTQGAWVQLRNKGVLPPGVSASLRQVADPRYQAFGPIIFGKFLPKTSQQLTDYVTSHDIYKFNPDKVTHTTKDGSKVFAYPVKLDVGNLKILNDSAASSEGFGPGDVQASVDQLDNYKSITVTIYIASGNHQFFGLDATNGDQTMSIRYSDFDSVNLPAEPQTKLAWADFTGAELQIEAAAAAHEGPTQLDSQRATRLAAIKAGLAAYFATNNAYPTFTQLNDPVWIQNNLAGLDPEALHDPLAVTAKLSAKPTAKSFAYQPVAADGKTACDNVSQNCSKYTLTAILSNGKPYAIQDTQAP